MVKRLYVIVIIFLFSSGCFANIEDSNASLDTALLNHSYSYQFSVDPAWLDWDGYFFRMTAGTLPSGMGLDADGRLIGTPAEVGNFDFRITAYDIDYGFYSDEIDPVDYDWFTLFVTEESTNEDCPLPNNEDIQEYFICVGEIVLEDPENDDAITLDINLHVPEREGRSNKLGVLNILIQYNGKVFYLNEEEWHSGILREAATRAQSDLALSFYNNHIEIELRATYKSFFKGGRLLDLPFYIKDETQEGTHSFTVEVRQFDSLDDSLSLDLPELIQGEVEIEVSSDS